MVIICEIIICKSDRNNRTFSKYIHTHKPNKIREFVNLLFKNQHYMKN